MSPYWVLLLGILTIQIWSIIGDLLDFGWGPIWFFAVMFGIFGALLKFIAWTVGLGAAVLTRFGTAEGWGGTGGNAYATAAGGAGAPPEHQQSSSVDEPSVLQDSSFTEAAPPSEVEPAEREEKPPPAPDQS